MNQPYPHKPATLLLTIEWLWVFASVASAVGFVIHRYAQSGMAGIGEVLNNPLLVIVLLVLASVHWFIISDLAIGGHYAAFMLGTKFLAVFAIAVVMAVDRTYFWPLYGLLMLAAMEFWLAYQA